MKKIHPSSAAFMIGDLVMTDYDSGCLRSILLAHNGARSESIPKVYAEVGAAHENWIEANVLKPDKRLVVYAREVPIKMPVPGCEDVLYSGRMDVLACYVEVGQVILETKGTISKNTRLSVIRKGLVKLNHLAQLTSYMIAKRITRGKIIAGYYERDPDTLEFVHCEGREFKVEIADDGGIVVDGFPTAWTVADQLRHRLAAARVLSAETVPPRPDKATQAFGGPCSKCLFKSVCDNYDNQPVEGTYAFIEAGREAARAYNASPPRGARPPHPQAS
jgi:hypothetical protein